MQVVTQRPARGRAGPTELERTDTRCHRGPPWAVGAMAVGCAVGVRGTWNCTTQRWGHGPSPPGPRRAEPALPLVDQWESDTLGPLRATSTRPPAPFPPRATASTRTAAPNGPLPRSFATASERGPAAVSWAHAASESPTTSRSSRPASSSRRRPATRQTRRSRARREAPRRRDHHVLGRVEQAFETPMPEHHVLKQHDRFDRHRHPAAEHASGCQHPRVVVGRDIDAIELQHPKCPAPSPQRHGERPSGLAASHAGGGGNHLRFRAMERRGCRRKGVDDCDPFGLLPVSTVARGSPNKITSFAIVQPRADVARGEDAGAGAAHFDERMVQPRRSGRRGREVEQQSVDVGTQVGLTVRARAIERQHERVSRRQHSLGYFVQQRELARSNEHGAARPVVRDERGHHENRGREQLANPGWGPAASTATTCPSNCARPMAVRSAGSGVHASSGRWGMPQPELARSIPGRSSSCTISDDTPPHVSTRCSCSCGSRPAPPPDRASRRIMRARIEICGMGEPAVL